VLLLASVAYVQQLVPVGEQFQVNTTIEGHQRSPEVAQTESGFLVVWESGDAPSSVRGQLFDDLGNPVGEEIPISPSGGFDQRQPSVGDVPGAGFLVAWGNQSTPWAIDGRMIGFDGTPQGDLFTVSEQTPYPREYRRPRVAGNPNGGFVVVWSGYERVMGRALTSDGQPSGDAFQVAYSGSYNCTSDAFMGGFDDHGRFVVAWGYDDDGGEYGVGVTRMTASGEVLQQGFWEAGSSPVATAVRPDGGFVVSLHHFYRSLQRYNRDGRRLGDYLIPDSLPTDVAVTARGDLVMVEEVDDVLTAQVLAAEGEFLDPVEISNPAF
jgi:hypothetical protein